jgi:two-component system sensor histidine kinase ChiS
LRPHKGSLTFYRSARDAVAEAKKTATEHGPLIQVVDDDPATLRIIEVLLERNGYTVRTANTGENALSLLREKIPAAMILDVNMPGMSGFDVCQIIKRDERFDKIPIILLTAQNSPQDFKTGHDAGAVIYMVKPFKPERLLQVIRLLISPAA